MRILQIHNRYQQRGGEDAVVEAERRLLARHGHDVHVWSVGNDPIQGVWAKARTAWNAAYSWPAREQLSAYLARTRPDVAHVHNFFPLLSPSVYDACRDSGVPVVQTLHNYRIICANGLFLRNGRPCERCLTGTPYQAALFGCYRGSALGSLAVARMTQFHRREGTWQKAVQRFIALTEFGRRKFVEAGLPAERIRVKPNFVDDRPRANGRRRDGALFVGRLSPEKGIDVLLRAAALARAPLRVVGDGPLFGDVVSREQPQVTALGRKTPDEVAAEMARAALLVVPSICYEGFPLTIVEAFSSGLPVIASRLGALAELVEDGVTGLHVRPGDPADLAEKLRWAQSHPLEMREMGRNARRIYEIRYTPEANLDMLIAIYEEAIRAV
jgi:glycosyltransferase involved in cell wall biosynthesis